MQHQPKLLDQLRAAVRLKHYSRRTEQAYASWVRRFVRFQGMRHPAELGTDHVRTFLTHLAVSDDVAASTQNQALAALLFLYRHVVEKEVGDLAEVVRAKRPRRLPSVFTQAETHAVLGAMQGTPRLVAALLYGSGLHLLEALRLRVKDVDFARREITVRDGKGAKDRLVMLPTRLDVPLRAHLRRARALHAEDLAAGHGRVYLPHALERRYPNAAASWTWQYLFPAARWSVDPSSGETRRHHLSGSSVQKAVTAAVAASAIAKRGSCHTFRHSFATHLLEAG